MCNIDTMRQFGLPHLSSSSDAKLSCKDASRSITELGTMFVAAMVDAKELIDHLEVTFCDEFWPAICEIEELRSRVKELEKLLHDSRKQCEEKERLELEARLERKVERARMLGENDVLRIELEQRERLELEARQEREVERVRLLGENDVLRIELGQEKMRFDRALQEAVQRHLQQAEDIEKKGRGDEANKLLQDNQALLQRQQILQEENLNLKEKCQRLADKMEQVEQEKKLSDTKILLLDKENQTLGTTRAAFEKSLALKKRRLSLPKPEKLPTDKSPSLSLAGKGAELVHVVSCKDPEGSNNKDRVQSLCDLQRQPCLQEGNNQADKHSPPSERETTKPMRGRSPPVNAEANTAIYIPAVATPVKCPSDEAMCQPGSVEESKGADVLHVECSQIPKAGCDVSEDSTSVKRAQAEAMCQAGLAQKLETADALEEDVECFQRPKADCDGEPNPDPSDLVDSDETVMDADDQKIIAPDVAQEPPVICISTENQAAHCDDMFQLVSRGKVTNEVIRTGSVERKVEDRRVAQAGAFRSVVSKTHRPPSRSTYLSQKLAKKSKDRPWRQTRSRAEPREGDPHDSFLDTPRERILAKLAAHSQKQSGTAADSRTARQRAGLVPVINVELDGSGLEAKEGELRAARGSSANSRLITDSSNAGCHDKKVNKGRTLKSPPANSRLVTHSSNAACHDKKDTKGRTANAPTYKYNEPVRKKRDREELEAIDCKQCKKFYDAVEAEDANGVTMSRCDHHKAVSRHRFRCLPPPTPDGFWDLGFNDSK